jgi:hypothetical protein
LCGNSGCKCEYIRTFNRNNEIALKLPFAALRPRQRYQRIYDEERFLEVVRLLQKNGKDVETVCEDIISKQIENYSNEMAPLLLEKMAHFFSRKRFEDFIMTILKDRETTGEIINSYVYRGWGTDQGCDIYFEYYNSVLSKKESVIMQLKAYTGKAFISEAISNLHKFLDSGQTANQAIIMTTATEIDVDDFVKAKKDFENKFNIPLNLLYGKSMLSWVFKFGNNVLFSESILE